MPNHPGFFIGDGDDFVVHHNWRPLDAHFTFAIGQPSG
jgi:hypothetical protein